MINNIATIKAFRETLLEAEVVIVTATGETVAIRDGEYDPLIYTRPADPAKTPIIEADDLAVIERQFDPSGKTLHVREFFIPNQEEPEANDTDMQMAIMQYTVGATANDGGIVDLTTTHNTARYIREVFDPEKPHLDNGQAQNISVVIDNVSEAPALRADGEYIVPVSVFFRVYNDNSELT